jgi:hypothetical protein
VFFGSQDAIQQIQVISNQYGAQYGLNAAEYAGRISFAELRHDQADGKALLFAQPVRDHIGLVVQCRSSVKNALLCLRSNAMLDRKIVYQAGHRRLRQPDMSCEFLKAYPFAPDYIRSRVMAYRFFSHLFTFFSLQPEIMERRIEVQFFRA